MMEEMHEQGVAEKKAEVEAHATYTQWCVDTTRTKGFAIRDGKDKVEMLSAGIQKAAADVTKLGDDITGLDAAVAQAEADKASATEVRATERADYEALHADYTSNIEEMAGALAKMAAQPADIGNSLLQLQAKTTNMPEKARALLAAFVEENESGTGAPAGAAFSSSTGNIQEIVETMQEKMHGELAAVEQEEAQQKHAFSALTDQLDLDIENMNNEKDTKTKNRAQRKEDESTMTGDKSDTTATLNEDTTYLADLTAQCETKATDFAARQKLRAEELVAVQKAIDIISSKSVAGKADKHLPALVQSFAQLRATTERKLVSQAQRMLTTRAKKTQSKVLMQMASKMSGPFDKVTRMVEEMIAKLESEAGEEAEHKEWCDGELQTNKQTRDAKTSEVDQLTALSDKLTAEISTLGNEIANLQSDISSLDSALAEATQQRTDEKKKNTVAIADAKEAQEAVNSALKVLKDFYAKAATATQFTQTNGPSDEAPASFDKPYTGMGGASGGVVGMLEVILSDFLRLEEQTTADEATASREFATFSDETNADKSAKSDSMDHKEKSQIKKQRELAQATRDLKNTHAELDSAMEYYSKLKPECLDAGVDFEERTARREEEVESLKEALKLLGDE